MIVWEVLTFPDMEMLMVPQRRNLSIALQETCIAQWTSGKVVGMLWESPYGY